MINILGKKVILFGISIVVLAIGITFLSLYGLKLGIDFKGGSLIEYSFDKKPTTEELRAELTKTDLADTVIQPTGDNGYLLRTKEIDNAKYTTITTALEKKFGKLEKLRFETVGPTVSKELTQKAILAIIVASIFIIIYISFAFRKVPKPVTSWRFGVCAVIALLHDVFVVLGVFAVLGKVYNIEVDSLLVTALLTVMGFSVHDTIVVFDRIRENLLTRRDTFEHVANISVVQTLARSLNTSLTLIFVALALYLFGGTSIKNFVLALLVGTITGTYSSIFTATPLLVVWQNRIDRKGKVK